MRMLSVSILVALVAACSGPAPESNDLIPALPAPAPAPRTEVSEVDRMRMQLREIGDSVAWTVPPLPERPPLQLAAPSGPDPWVTERVNATTFDTLTDSILAIQAKMPREDAELFDRGVKFMLAQITTQPMMVRAAGSGIMPSDREILDALKPLVHNKSPALIVKEAYELDAAQKKAASAAPSTR